MGFTRDSKSYNPKSFLDRGTSLTGELRFSGSLHIDGNVHGSIRSADDLVVGKSASVHADIKAAEVQIHGAVSGNVHGSRRVQIFSTGRVRGDILTPQLVIEEGGQFDGQSRSSSEDSEAASAVQPASESSHIQNE